MFLMGCKDNLHFLINTIIFLLFTIIVHASSIYNNSSSLDATFRDFAAKTLTEKSVTGTLLNVSLPTNFSGIQVTVIRLRSATFWAKGTNFSSFYIPPGVLPFPFAKRFVIVYQDLGKLSDQFYNVPGYSLAAPVIGFMAYDATNLSVLGNDTKLNVINHQILVQFSEITPKDGNFSGLKCVKFGEGGLIQLSNIGDGNKCSSGSNGHFSVVVPDEEEVGSRKKKRISKRRKSIIVIVSCCVGVILVVMILVSIYQLIRQNKIRKMEGESEKGEAFDTTWVGASKMPCASMVRTQPVLEHDENI
ncbi:uncharacterized protein [Euphorbia lathyris]|uniref:uncharacterized protein n=1 Tax=Euphorbia lathyris TaxID=212925 RepID=UPI003313A3B5